MFIGFKEPAVEKIHLSATIRRVTTAEELADFARVLADLAKPRDEAVVTFFQSTETPVLDETSPMRFYVAYVDGEPGAVSELFVGAGVTDTRSSISLPS